MRESTVSFAAHTRRKKTGLRAIGRAPADRDARQNYNNGVARPVTRRTSFFAANSVGRFLVSARSFRLLLFSELILLPPRNSHRQFHNFRSVCVFFLCVPPGKKERCSLRRCPNVRSFLPQCVCAVHRVTVRSRLVPSPTKAPRVSPSTRRQRVSLRSECATGPATK